MRYKPVIPLSSLQITKTHLCGPRYKEGRDEKGVREEKETRKWKNEEEDEREEGILKRRK